MYLFSQKVGVEIFKIVKYQRDQTIIMCRSQQRIVYSSLKRNWLYNDALPYEFLNFRFLIEFTIITYGERKVVDK